MKFQKGEFIRKSIPKTPCVYSLTNIRNGKIYIGCTIELKMRICSHFDMLCKGAHENEELQKDFDNGDVFEVNILFKTRDARTISNFHGKVKCVETWFIMKYNTVEQGYNKSYNFGEYNFQKRMLSPVEAAALVQ